LMAKIKTDGKLNLPHFGRDNFTATKSTDDDILRNIAMVKEKYDYVIDPHTACGFQDLDQNKTNVVLATAHPAKFPEVTKKAIGEIVTEESLEALKEKTQKRYPLDATAAAVRAFVEKNAAE
ncbi:hypothetical protein OAK43_04915, partial [Verrucomicrobiales bacterium]|nr:hypothetical protein [Verrucomicrobiales bacterium]